MPETAFPMIAPAETESHLSPPPPPVKRRSILIDVVRGMAISLVALGHTCQGIVHRGWWGTSPFGVRLLAFIYSFHMPAFFFVSGIFLIPGADKRGTRHFILGRTRTILYPYVLWCFLGNLLTIPLARFMFQKTPTLHEFLFGLFTGSTGWFLPTILFAVILAALMRRVPMPILFLAACAASLYTPPIGITFFDRGLNFFPFLVAGMWARNDYERVDRLPVALAAVLAVALGILVYFQTTGQMRLPLPFLADGLLGTLMLLLFARCLGRTAPGRVLAWAGEASFGIFLISAYGQGLGRQLLILLHISQPYVHLIVPTLTAIFIPAWLYNRRVKLHINWLFVWPWA
jgi:fucose 4-O-acetylase-like acetyltransferase